jgi:phosphate transport system permease protein
MDVATTQPRSTSLVGSSPSVRARKFADQTATVVLWLMASSIILLLALFIIYMFYLGARYLTPSFLFGMPAETSAGGGVGPEIYNSFYILILTLIFTVPISTAAGVYLQEYAAPGRFRELVVFSAESLATIPSICSSGSSPRSAAP